MKISSLYQYHKHELHALFLFVVGAGLSMLALIQRIPQLWGLVGVFVLSTGLFYYSLKYTSELVYRKYYKESYEIEHETIEEEIRKSMSSHRYQEAVLNRYGSACRDLGLSQEQSDWLMTLLMEEKRKVDEELNAQGGGQI
jgi:hypothetical protein